MILGNGGLTLITGAAMQSALMGALLVQAFVKSGIDNHLTFPITYKDDRLHEMHKKIIDKFIPLYSLPRGKNLV